MSVRAGAAAADATAGSDGTWRALLPPQISSSEHSPAVVLSASSGGKTITVTDVLFGDVWVCSGQSNMVNCAESLTLLFALVLRCDSANVCAQILD
eukprot:SAG31_NODE_5006_length_2806_cov_2.510898_3_plen_96_part_00